MICGNIKQCHGTLFVSIWDVGFDSTIFLTFATTMRPTSAANHSSVLSLLEQGYSYHQIHNKTSISLGTISARLGRDANKENNPGGHPSKLSIHDKQSIIQQINSDNGVQAPNFINSTFTHLVHPQTVRNALKEAGFHSATKKKVPMLKLTHHQGQLKFARYHENWTVEDWKRVLWSDETKINHIGSDGKVYAWKQWGEPLSSHTTAPTVKHGGENNLMVWGCMGWNGVGKLVEVQGKINSEQYCEILEDGMEESFEKLEMEEEEHYFQQDNDPKHTSK